MIRHSKFHVPRSKLVTACLALLCSGAGAVENGAIRIAPGWGGGELALPLTPGLNGTLGVMRYEADSIRDSAGNAPQVGLPGGLSAVAGARVRVTGIIPRLVWVSDFQMFGANLGAVALVPYLEQEQSASLTGQFGALVPPPMAAGIQAQLDAQANALGGKRGALGDLEVGPVLSWVGERSNAVFTASFIAPTGQYDKTSAVNAGAGNYWTFRPTLSLGYAGDGWDAGVRMAVAFNGRNSDTQIKSGAYFEADWSLLKHVNDSWRVGVQGYLLQQFQDDDGPGVSVDGNRSRVYALGPAVSWTNSDATWLVDAKYLREFGVRNRPEGATFWLSVSRRF